MSADRAAATVRVGPTALLTLLLAATAAACVLYGIALGSDDAGVMRLANGSLPALLGVTRPSLSPCL